MSRWEGGLDDNGFHIGMIYLGDCFSKFYGIKYGVKVIRFGVWRILFPLQDMVVGLLV